jgi:hypothetical protein
VSTGRYFGLLALVQVPPLVFGIAQAVVFFPPPDHRQLRDPTVAAAFGLPPSEMVFVGYIALGVCAVVV